MSFSITRKVSFLRPTVGPKTYLTVGASGWAETFDRKACDKQLRDYLGSLDLSELVCNFLTQIQLEFPKKETWVDVTRYLSRIFGVKPDEIPLGVGVAFWGNVVVSMESKGAN